MRIRALDSDGDWTWGKGRNNYLSGKAARAQNIGCELKAFLGDCFWDLGKGIDWWNLLGGKSSAAIDFTIQTVIASCDGFLGFTKRTAVVGPGRAGRYDYHVSVAEDASSTGSAIISVSSTRLLTELGDLLTTEAGDPIGL